eukprot:1635203-Pleurochrysis_carterae.AAC.4
MYRWRVHVYIYIAARALRGRCSSLWSPTRAKLACLTIGSSLDRVCYLCLERVPLSERAGKMAPRSKGVTASHHSLPCHREGPRIAICRAAI